MDKIQFFIVEFINEGFIDEEFDNHHYEIQIYINGHDLMDLVERIEHAALDPQHLYDSSGRSYAGLNPEWCPGLRDEFLGRRHAPYIAPYSVLLTCTCFQDGCNSVMAKIEATDQTITWKDFTTVLHGEQARSWGGRLIDYSGLGPFVFDREQYLQELDALKLDDYR